MRTPVPATLVKPPEWSRVYAFDFSLFAEFRDDGQSILAASVASDTTGLTLGTPVVNGAVAQLRVSGGSEGVTYALTCTVTTSGGSTLHQVGYLAVEGDPADVEAYDGYVPVYD